VSEESGEFGVSEQTGSPTYRYRLTVPPGRKGIQPNVAFEYNPGSLQVAHGWTVDVPKIDRITDEGV